MNRISFGQIKFGLNTNKSNFSSIFEIQPVLIYLAILSFLICFLILFKLIQKRQFIRKFYLITTNLISTNYSLTKKFNLIALIVFFYNLYFWIFRILVLLNIKSSIVVLNTSSIIDNNQDLLETDKLVCWVKNNIEHNLAKSSRNTFISKLYAKERFNFYTKNYDKCEFGVTIPFDLDERLNDMIFIMDENNIISSFIFLANFLKGDPVYFKSDHVFYEIDSFYLYRNDFKSKTLPFL